MADIQETRVKVSALLPVRFMLEGNAKTKHKTLLQCITLLCECLL
jgi:hypothetical protein